MEKAEAMEQERDIGTIEKDMMKLNMLLYKKRGLHHELEQSNSLMESDFIGSLRVRPCLLLFGRSCSIVGHHHLTDDFLPATAVFGSPYAL